MKKWVVLSLAAAFLSLSCGPPDVKKAMDQAVGLTAQKKYQAAYDLLAQADPSNENPILAREKVQVLMEGAVYDRDSQSFYFKGSPQPTTGNAVPVKGTAYAVQPIVILNQLIHQYPHHWDLYETLGEYYIWVSADEAAAGTQGGYAVLASEKLTTALRHQDLDGDGFYALGTAYSRQLRHAKAVEALNRALKRGNTKPDIYYTLAENQEALGQYAPAVDNAEKAYQIYPGPARREAAAVLTAMNYIDLKDYHNEEKFLLSAHQDLPQSTELTSWLMDAYIRNGEPRKAEDFAETFLLPNRLDTSGLQTLSEMFSDKSAQSRFASFLRRMKKKYAKKKDVLAGLNFCEGMTQIRRGRLPSALADFKKARSLAETLTPAPGRFLSYFKTPEFGELEKANPSPRTHTD